jgi:2-keto-4-pentenoate hydratase/2-oxohepta-3-ene-1,7-dioic acid hydratase in catechol pathway
MTTEERTEACILVEGEGSPRPVGTIVCVGRNFADHAREMGATPPAEPILFLKPATALLGPGAALRLPDWSQEVHHELELVVLLAAALRDAAPEEAARAIEAYGVGLDLTARDLQNQAKKAGHPWAVAKGWPGSAPVSVFRSAVKVGDPGTLAMRLAVNGETRQSDTTASMLRTVPQLLAYASSRFHLRRGDLLFTGTPAGVGLLRPGDRVEAEIERVGRLELLVAGG